MFNNNYYYNQNLNNNIKTQIEIQNNNFNNSLLKSTSNNKKPDKNSKISDLATTQKNRNRKTIQEKISKNIYTRKLVKDKFFKKDNGILLNKNYNEKIPNNKNGKFKQTPTDKNSENIKKTHKTLKPQEIYIKKRLNEIDRFFRDIKNHKKMISTEIRNLKKEIENNELCEKYKKMEENKMKIRKIIDDFETKMGKELGEKGMFLDFEKKEIILEQKSAEKDKNNIILGITNEYNNYIKKFIQNTKDNNREEKEEKLDEINNFFKNIDIYQEIITEIIKNLKNEIGTDRTSKSIDKMKQIKYWLKIRMDDLKNKIGVGKNCYREIVNFDPLDVI